MNLLRSLRFGMALCSLGLGVAVMMAHAKDAEPEPRFTSTLRPSQRVSVGLDQLSEDNLAVIDGLVRQDEAASRLKNNGVDHTRFSDRHTAHEREIAGLDRLSVEQTATLDELVRRRIAGPEDETTANTADFNSPPLRAAPTVVAMGPDRRPEIHGEVSYTLGWSKAGSFQGGDLVLDYYDPARKFSVTVGYSEYRGKGLPWCP